MPTSVPTSVLDDPALASARRLARPARDRGPLRWIVGLLVAAGGALFLPWQQSVEGRGQLTALSPADRAQDVPAIIGGRIAAWYVQEGAFVRRGERIARLAEVKDQYLDPATIDRYGEQLAAKRAAVAAKRAKATALAQQIAALEQGLALSLDKARNAVVLRRAGLEATLADSAIAADQLARRERLTAEGLSSTNDLQAARLRAQQAAARTVEKRAELANAEIELRSLGAEYGDKLAKARADRSATLAEVGEGEADASKLRNAVDNLALRNRMYDIVAPQDGYVVRALRAGVGEQVKEGDAIVTVMPARPRLAAAIAVRAVDVPLVAPGRRVRVQFDGWPALQFSGWPQVAVGTFGGIVAVVDRVGAPDGTFRVLVTPDPADEPWPAQLRQGSGVIAWAMLDEVRLGYELWRRVNGFPQSLSKAPTASLALALLARLPAVATPPDSVVTMDAFMRRVAVHHPAVRQAQLGVAQAEEEQRVARGAFDPTVGAAWDRKTFGSVAYYDYVSAALTVPTPVGVDVKLGYERAAGRYASPDRRTPSGGLLTAGLSVPLGPRLVIDERRTAVAVARSLRDAAEADRDAAVNRVLVQAARDYARWYEGVRRAAVAREGVALAAFRLDAVRRRVAAGEAAPLDTVEAQLELRRRRVQEVEAAQAALAARLAAEAHLWDARGLPDTLPAGAVPSAELRDAPVTAGADVEPWVAQAVRSHPDVQRADARLAQAAAQRRLAAWQRLPQAAVELGALGTADDATLQRVDAGDDLKLGLSARTPLLFLRERGRANAAGLRVEQQALERDRARREVAVAARTAAGEVAAVAAATAAQREAVEQARLMVRGEQRRFEAGESTLFLVNARERTLLDEALRLAGLEARAFTARAELAALLGWWRTPGRDAW